MNKKSWIYGLIGLLAGIAVTTLLITYNARGQYSAQKLVTPAGKTKTTATSATPLKTTQAAPSNTTQPSIAPRMMRNSDQHFIVMMIPHHEGAVAMAELAASRAKHPEIKKLAEAIKTTQTQEIEQMRTWYKQWYGTDVPIWQPGMGWGMHRNWNNRLPQQQGNNSRTPLNSRMGRSPKGMGSMGTNLSALQNATDFDREFIEQMIPHHEMGVMMASMVLNSGQHPEIRNLAESIISSQTAEIEQMQQWYQTWYQ